MNTHIPLAERLRPQQLDDVVGQDHLLGPGQPLRRAIERGRVRSMILWGPPGSGKTTLARIIANAQEANFYGLSAVTAGVKEIRQVAREAREGQQRDGRPTILFLDEVHRLNKSQQDVLLPFVEDGTLVLIGATTENPSFEVNGALRSRSQLLVLKPLERHHILRLLKRAVSRNDLFEKSTVFTSEALEVIATWAGGDARRAFNTLELCALATDEEVVNKEVVARVLQVRGQAIDKGGEHFYNLISALHKSIRGGDPDAALYWLARLLLGGVDPMYVARRLVRIASEDVGLADPHALRLTIAARDAALFLGRPEGDLALAEVAIYLALAPKSNRVYRAWKEAQAAVENHPEAEVPLHLRNAPTGLMKRLGYGRAYAYYFDDPVGSARQHYLPEELREVGCYQPGDEGWERKLRDRLEQLAQARREARRTAVPRSPSREEER